MRRADCRATPHDPPAWFDWKTEIDAHNHGEATATFEKAAASASVDNGKYRVKFTVPSAVGKGNLKRTLRSTKPCGKPTNSDGDYPIPWTSARWDRQVEGDVDPKKPNAIVDRKPAGAAGTVEINLEYKRLDQCGAERKP